MYHTIILDSKRQTLTFIGRGMAEVVRRGDTVRSQLALEAIAAGWQGKQFGKVVIFHREAVVVEKVA